MTVETTGPNFFRILNDDNSWTISLEGEIKAGDSIQIEKALSRAGRDGAEVYLNSPGGNLLEGMRIGRLIRKAGATTHIGISVLDPKNAVAGRVPMRFIPGYCYSACALAFLGGVYRYGSSETKYGVHRFASAGSPLSTDLDTAQIVSAAVSTYIREMDVNPALFDYMVLRGANDIRVLSTGEMTQLNVVNNDRQRAQWSVEVVDGGFYLRGVQTTVFGEGKATFVCGRHSVVMYSFYEVGSSKARSIEAGGWYHSIKIDNRNWMIPMPGFVKAVGGEISAMLPLTIEQAIALTTASVVGHSMQPAPESPLFVGYRIDIPSTAMAKVGLFIKNCLKQ